MAEVSNKQSPLEHKENAAKPRGWLTRYLPILSWLPSYQRSWLRFDLIAGATVWAVVVPEAVAYSQLAGVPPQAGLFAAPFLTGFIFGLALVIAIGQLPKLFGLPRVEGDFFQKAWQIIIHLGSTNGWTLLVGVLSLALLFGLERFLPRIPASLVAVVFGILVVALFGLDKQGVAIVGAIPRGLPTPSWPSIKLDDYLGLLPGALGVALVLYAEHVSAAQKFAVKHHYDLDANQELIALGVSNFLAGLFGGFAGGGSLSKTTVNEVAGARTQISGIF